MNSLATFELWNKKLKRYTIFNVENRLKNFVSKERILCIGSGAYIWCLCNGELIQYIHVYIHFIFIIMFIVLCSAIRPQWIKCVDRNWYNIYIHIVQCKNCVGNIEQSTRLIVITWVVTDWMGEVNDTLDESHISQSIFVVSCQSGWIYNWI